MSDHRAPPTRTAIRRRTFCRTTAAAGLSSLMPLADSSSDEQAVTLVISSPRTRQVIQREGYVAAHAHDHEPGGPKLGEAKITLQGSWTGPVPARLEVRCILHEGCIGRDIPALPLDELTVSGPFERRVTIPAGGWYRLELRALNAAGTALGRAEVSHVGVGEVFLIAGQSYAAGANDELQRIEDVHERSALLDLSRHTWRTAHDPFPQVGEFGTIWPAFANALQPLLRVPVGLANLAAGGTASRQWLPGESLYRRLANGGRAAGRFRYVLWQQGESDVIEGISTETYRERLQTIRNNLATEWRFEPTWLLAKSTLHPTVYNKPVDEGRIRAAIDQLWRQPGFAAGPDTDILAGENRGGPRSKRHFSPIGQRRAGLLWFAAVWAALHQESQ